MVLQDRGQERSSRCYNERVIGSKRTFAKGQAFLALVFLIGTVIVLVGATLAFLASSYVDTSYGYRSSVQADAAANSGAEDAMLQLQRDSAFASSGYTVTSGSTTATVTVTQSTPSAGFITILSTATVSGYTRKIDIVLAVNSLTEQTTVVSWQEVQ
jgi:uncharacterized protein (UPF0333 family)